MRFFNEEFTWILDLKNCNLSHTFIDSAPLKKISSYRNKNILTDIENALWYNENMTL